MIAETVIAGTAATENVIAADRTVALLRSFCQDWLDRADAEVPARIMSAEYEVQIGGIVLAGLGEYVPATLGQLEDFRGLQITVHDLISNGSQLALRFTEHGASQKAGGNAAAWRGIALFWSDGIRLVRNVTEEDYTARRRQLSAGVADVIDPPATAPWSTPIVGANAGAEQTVRDWLAAGGLTDEASELVVDDGAHSTAILDVTSTAVLDLFSSGDCVAFRVVESGGYRDGLGLPPAAQGASGSLSSVGFVRVAADGAIRGHVVRDRAGLRRALSRA